MDLRFWRLGVRQWGWISRAVQVALARAQLDKAQRFLQLLSDGVVVDDRRRQPPQTAAAAHIAGGSGSGLGVGVAIKAFTRSRARDTAHSSRAEPAILLQDELSSGVVASHVCFCC